MDTTRQNRSLTPPADPESISLPSHNVERFESTPQSVDSTITNTAAFPHRPFLTSLFTGILLPMLTVGPPAGTSERHLWITGLVFLVVSVDLAVISLLIPDDVCGIRSVRWRTLASLTMTASVICGLIGLNVCVVVISLSAPQTSSPPG